MKRPQPALPLLALILAALVCAPWLLGVINLRLLNEALYYGLFAVSLNLITGYGGLLSLGHAAYFGTGAYVTALALLHIPGLGVIPALVMGALGAGILGAFFSIFLVRVSGTYYAMLTLAFGQLVYGVALKWRQVTGGDDGLGSFPKPPIDLPLLGSVDMLDTTNFYWFTLLVVGLALWAAWHLTRTSLGVSITLLRENEQRARFLGHNTAFTRFWLFTISSALAGAAGGLFALFQEFVATSSVDIVKSLDVVLMMAIGGVNSFFGPLLGSLFMVLVGDELSRVTDIWEFYIGAIFIAMVLFFREGLVGLVRGAGRGLAAAWSRATDKGGAR